MEIAELDRNFRSVFTSAGLKMYNVNEPGFALYGLSREQGEQDFKRLPHAVAQNLGNEPLTHLYRNTAGLRVRFRTDSRRILLTCVFPEVNHDTCMPLSGTSCFDLYADGQYCGVLEPGIDLDNCHIEPQMGEHGYTGGHTFPERRWREILINFPLYNNVDAVYIGLEAQAKLLPAEPYRHHLPVVFYGSSITQGAAASHPGNCYSSMLSRWLDTDFVNLGFSGACRAEPAMAAYLATLPMSAFVYDYDHNAPSAAELERTHGAFFQIIRDRCPTLPIVLVSAADNHFPDALRRRDMIRHTYEQAAAAGDTNVYFVDGREIYRPVGGAGLCVVDDAHPNDLGFWCMANAIGQKLAPILGEAWRVGMQR